MIPSSLSQARRDPRLRRFAKAVVALQFCHEYLDTQDYRPLKIEIVAREVLCDFGTAVAALRTLVALGYIARGPRPHGDARHYRLLPAPLLPDIKRRAA